MQMTQQTRRYFRLLNCQSTQVKDIQFVNDQCIEYTTAQARLNSTLFSWTTSMEGTLLWHWFRNLYKQSDEWVPPLGDY